MLSNLLSHQSKRLACKLGTVVFAVLLSASLALTALSTPIAHAEVNRSDIIVGRTLEEQNLSITQAPNIEAQSALVISEDGTVYFERNADEERKIASITKVMTAIVALENTDLNTDITVSETAASVGESSAELQVGDVLELSDAIKGLLVLSGNDAAQAIAETIGAQLRQANGLVSSTPEEAVEAFVDKMNETAATIGMTHSVFRNPHGLDDEGYEGDHHSSARDVALMVAHAMKKQVFRESVNKPTDTIAVIRSGESVSIDMTSTDILLGEYEGACGVKTGFTDQAGYCFAGAVNRGAGDVYTVVLNAPDDASRFGDTRTLFDWYYTHLISYPLVHSAETTQDGSPLIAAVAHDDWVDKTVPATLADPDLALTVFDLEGNISQEPIFYKLTGSVQKGQKVGELIFKQHNKELTRVDLVAAEDVPAPGILESLGIWWDKFLRGFTDAPTQAESILYNTTPLIVDKTKTTVS